MSKMRRSKKQYVEHSEEHVGEEVTPFVALLVDESQMKKSKGQQQSVDVTTSQGSVSSNAKKRVRFWRRLTALFS
ncbi:MAG: hypothetical protein SFU99_01495 [Saprospiraceae bacterium]|nr:hypothetical protein [Saprospiraceae bacterium]